MTDLGETHLTIEQLRAMDESSWRPLGRGATATAIRRYNLSGHTHIPVDSLMLDRIKRQREEPEEKGR